MHAGRLAVLRCQQVTHVGTHRQGQPALLAHPLRQPVQLARGHGGQRFGRERLGAADVAGQRIHEPRTELISQCGLVLVREKHEIFTASRQFPDGPGRERRAHVHEDPALQHVPAAQRERALDGQR